MPEILIEKKEIHLKLIYCGSPSYRGYIENVLQIAAMTNTNIDDEVNRNAFTITNSILEQEKTFQINQLIHEILLAQTHTASVFQDNYTIKTKICLLPLVFKVYLKTIFASENEYSKRIEQLMKSVDGICFVADSDRKNTMENLRCIDFINIKLQEEKNRRRKENRGIPFEIPIIIEYDNRSSPNALPTEILNRKINENYFPWIEAESNKGIGVLETYEKLLGLALNSVCNHILTKESSLNRASIPLLIASTSTNSDLNIQTNKIESANIEKIEGSYGENNVSKKVSSSKITLTGDPLHPDIEEAEKIAQSERKRLVDENGLDKVALESIVTIDKKMFKIFEYISKIKDLNDPILIIGESGTGKELIADLVHKSSSRKSDIILKINCASLNENLIESELFGYVKGAFTNANKDKLGYFDIANNGTLFLDEIGELSLNLQGKLLRVIEYGDFMPLGSTKPKKTNARIIAATNKNLSNEIEKGHFKLDLFYRLEIYKIDMIPLRMRYKDLDSTLKYYLEKESEGKVTSISKCANECIKGFLSSEPACYGNIRSVINMIKKALVFNEGNTLTLSSLPEDVISYRNIEKENQKFLLFELLNETWIKANRPKNLYGIEKATYEEAKKRFSWLPSDKTVNRWFVHDLKVHIGDDGNLSIEKLSKT